MNNRKISFHGKVKKKKKKKKMSEAPSKYPQQYCQGETNT